MGYLADGALVIGYDTAEQLTALGAAFPDFGAQVKREMPAVSGDDALVALEAYMSDEAGFYLDENARYAFPNAKPTAKVLKYTLSEKWYEFETESILALLASLGFNVSGEIIGEDHAEWGYQSNAKNELELITYASVDSRVVASHATMKKSHAEMGEILASGVDDAAKVKALTALVKKLKTLP